MIGMSFFFAMSLALVDPGCEPPRGAGDQPAADQFLIVPLRIHILRTPGLELANCKLKDGDVERVVRNVNTIWRKAGIVFGVESVLREAAVQQDRFRLIVQMNEGQIGLPDFQLLLPKPSRAFDGLHAYFFHELPFNGAYLGEESVVLQEGAQLNPVAGGIDDPVARVLGHCFGRTFGLRPRRAQIKPACPGHDGKRSRFRGDRSCAPRGQDHRRCSDRRGCPQGGRVRRSRRADPGSETTAVVAHGDRRAGRA